MADERSEQVQCDADRVAELERELAEARARSEESAARAAALEGRMREAALRKVRQVLLEEGAARRGVRIDAERAAGLLERLTQDATAEVGEDGEVVVPEGERRKIAEQVERLISSIVVEPRVVAPPIAPGEPPVRSEPASGGGFVNAWEVSAREDGVSRGRAMIVRAARELERKGLL